MTATHLSALEARSTHILREAYASFTRLGMLWSIGKDSTVMLWLARKAFFGHVPFPLIHIDTSYKIPEMIQYRDRLVAEWGLDLLYGRNDAALEAQQSFPHGTVDRLTCCRLLKTDALKRTLSGEGERYRFNHATQRYELERDREPFTAVVVGVRSDEEGSRSKERYFSPRGTDSGWDVGDQPPEFWDQYNTEYRKGTHVRVHPLLDWTEADVWEYIDREGIPTVSLYYDAGTGTRYRSLGCGPCTRPVESSATTPAEIVVELTRGPLAHVAERAGRAQDTEDAGGLETLRREGYM
ncbi:MAG: sulfate adenylyltransferase subunit CysD [bacterium]